MAARQRTRGVVFALDLSPAQERLLHSYCGAARVAYNWVIRRVRENLAVRARERERGVPDDQLTPALSWSKFSLNKAWNASKDEVAPWWQEVSVHAFRSGIIGAAAALKNFSDSRRGLRSGPPVGFPRWKSRRRARLSVTFEELNHQLSWLHPGRHGVRLMLPRARVQSRDTRLKRQVAPLVWLHTVESTRRLYRLVETCRASIQQVTISHRGGRWQASFLVRYATGAERSPTRVARRGRTVGVDFGLTHLVTLSRPVPGLTDEYGHVANPRVLSANLDRLRRLDRALARCEKGSRNRQRLARRRARLHGRVARTRALYLHALTNALAGGFDVIAIEDLNVSGMARRGRHLGRALADASFAELRRQLTYKTGDRGSTLVVVDRFYPSSKTCSRCGAVKAKLPLSARIFECDTCGAVVDRDVNAARNLCREATKIRRVAPLDGHTTQHHGQQQPRRRATTGDAKRRLETRSDRHHRGGAGAGRLRAEPSHPDPPALIKGGTTTGM